MKKPIDRDRLGHIVDSIEKIESYLAGTDLGGFHGNQLLIDAVVRNLEIIGEAAANLTRELMAKYPTVEWRMAAAARNRLIHGYFDVDPQIIWDTAQNDLPRFKANILKIIEELE
jgi:uncharacterized protein with HEPN domain